MWNGPQLREFANIEFDNKLLLERLAKVVQQKTIDNEIHKSVQMHAIFKRKLGLTKKRLEMQKLTEENQRLLRRIQEVPPAYNHLDWEEEANRRDVIKKCMALYPEYYEREDAEKEAKRLGQTGTPGGSSLVKKSSSSGSPPGKSPGGHGKKAGGGGHGH